MVFTFESISILIFGFICYSIIRMKFLFFLFLFLFSLASFAESQWEPQTQGLKKIYHSIQKQKKLSSEAILNAFLFFETHQKKMEFKIRLYRHR